MTTELNPIERCYRALCAAGRAPVRMFSGNPAEHGLAFPAELLNTCYLPHCRATEYTPDPQGALTARTAISAYYAAHGAVVSPDRITLTSGSSESFRHLCDLLTQPGDEMLVPCPSYPLFDEIARLAHVTLRPYRLDAAAKTGWRIDLDSVAHGITPRTRAIVVVSPHNPTGAVATPDELQALIALAAQHRVALICDEVFSECYFGAGEFPRAMALGTPWRCFTLNGLSKLLALPQLKLSWIAATGTDPAVPQLCDALAHIADTFLSVHQPIQRALPALLEQSAAFRREYHAEIRRRRDDAVAALRAIPGVHVHSPIGGFYCIARLDTNRWPDEDALICDLMRRHGVFFHPGYFYDVDDGLHVVCAFITHPHALQRGIEALRVELHASAMDS